MKKLNKEALRNSYLAGIITESELSEKSIIDTPTPITLSKAASNPEMAKTIVHGGEKDGNKTDDVIAGKKVSIPVGKLKPAQTEITKEKAFGMAINFLLKGTWENQDFGNIVSNDNYIMDGHHRWAAVNLINPRANAIVTQIQLPGVALVSALNIVTVGLAGIKKGNVGKGNVAEFVGKNLKVVIDAAVASGLGGEYPIDAKDIQRALANIPGANGNYQTGSQIMMRNADSMPKQVMPGAPPRVEMPVIDEKLVDKVTQMLAKGVIDLKEPHQKGVYTPGESAPTPAATAPAATAPAATAPAAAQQLAEVRKIIKKEVYKMMCEIEEDPIKLSQEMVKSNEEQVKSLADELKYREADMRVSNLPKDEKDARVATMKLTKDRLESAKEELELSKQSQINSVKFSQSQTDTDTQSQISSQTEV